MEKDIDVLFLENKKILTEQLKYVDISGVVYMSITAFGKSYTAESEMPFIALRQIRKEMEEDKLLMLCKGSRYDVYPSGMSSIGYLAYIHVIGASATELVNILDEETSVKYISSVTQQEKYREEWLKSLGFKPKM